ncbi:MAG: signal peptidase I [Alphaproteobacteria bacterium]|nr:signal peptidase I [Alphaproteobacteria bacterium]
MSKSPSPDGFVETTKTVIYAVLIALTIRTSLYEPFSIPSGSMIPTLLVDDYLFVSKFSYGYSRHSLPFSLPLIPGSGRAWFTEVRRGDVVVFKTPQDNRTDFIKRIVGLPGDTVQLKNSILYINGNPVPRERAGEFVYSKEAIHLRVMRFKETLPDGRSYYVLEQTESAPQDNTEEFRIPPGHYFGMGDNRDDSQDSRFIGPIPMENLVGRAEGIWFSIDGSWWKLWEWSSSLRFSRMFTSIR